MIKSIKGIILIFTLAVFIFSCTNNTYKQREKTIYNYFLGLNSGDFNLISESVTDSITTSEMSFILTKNKQELYVHYKWDSVFNPKYKILEISADSNKFNCTIEKICERIKFLQDTSTIFKTDIEFDDGKIARHSITEYIKFDTETWESRRDSLVAWIDRNHPELTGFVFDLSPEGAQRYKKAMNLYRKNKE